MKTVYFSGPLFNQAEKDFNELITSILKNEGYKVFLPQKNGYDASVMEGISEAEKVKTIFEKDIQEIKNSDILFVVLDGRTPDEGACVELGYAYALGKRCYGIRTDVRALEIDMKLNPLVAGCLKKIFYESKDNEAIKQLMDYLKFNSL